MRNSFLNLVYREYYLSKKGIIAELVGMVIISVVSVLVIISMDSGNLKTLITQLMLKDVPDADAVLELYKSNAAFLSKAYPILCAAFMATTVAESSINDEKRVWKEFYRSSPISYWRKSFVKIFTIFVLIFFGFGVGTGYSAIVSAVSGIEMKAADFGLLMVGLAVGTVFAVLFLIYIMLFHSTDKAGLMLVATIAVPIVIVNINLAINKPEGNKTDLDIFEKLRGYCETLLPYTFIIIAGFLALGFFVIAALYKRREK